MKTSIWTTLVSSALAITLPGQALAEKITHGSAKEKRESAESPKENPLTNPYPWWLIINASYGAAALEYHDEAQTLSVWAPALELGMRHRGLRFGASTKWIHTWDSQNLFDVSSFISGDILSAEQDRHRSFGVYLKLNVGARWAPDRQGELAMLLQGSVGLRVLGLFTEAGMGPIIGPIGIPDPLGFSMEGRIGLELVEFFTLCKAGYF